MKYIIYKIIIIFLYLVSIFHCWESPCETMKNPNSTYDCIGKSTEYIEEVCCYLEGVQDNEPIIECVDVDRDDVRSELDRNKTKKLIINGTYWENYDLTYNSIEILRCYYNYIFPKILLLLFLLVLL